METLQAASRMKGAVSSVAHLGRRANEEVAKVFHFLPSSCSLSKRRGDLHRQTNRTLPQKEGAKPAPPWHLASSWERQGEACVQGSMAGRSWERKGWRDREET